MAVKAAVHAEARRTSTALIVFIIEVYLKYVMVAECNIERLRFACSRAAADMHAAGQESLYVSGELGAARCAAKRQRPRVDSRE